MVRKMLIALGLAVLIVPGVQPAWAEPAAERSAADFLPPDTVAYVSLGSAGIKEALEGTGLVQILREEEVRGFMAPLWKKLGLEGGAGIMGLPLPPQALAALQQIESTLSGPVTLALVGFPTDLDSEADLLPGAVVVAEVKGKENAAKALADKLIEALKARTAGPRQIEFIYEIRDGYLVASTSKETMSAVLGLMADPNAPSLADKPRFKAVCSRIAVPNNILTAYVDLNMPMMVLDRIVIQNRPELKAMSTVFGFTEIEAVGVSLGVDASAFKGTAYVYAPNAKSGLLRRGLSGRALALSDLKLIPEDAVAFGALSFDAVQSFTAFEDGMRSVGQDADLTEMLAEFRHELGFSLELDLLPSVEGPLVVYVTLPASGAMPEAVAMLKLRDPAKFRSCVDALFSKAPENDASVQSYKDTKLYTLRTGGPVSPSFAVMGDYALAAPFPYTLKSAMARLENPGRSVVDSPTYQAAVDRLSPETRLAALTDTKRAFNFGYTVAVPLLTVAAGRGGSFDLAALPAPETISRHLFVESYAVSREPEGIAIESYGVVPGGSATGGVLSVAGIGMSRHRPRARARAREMERAAVSPSPGGRLGEGPEDAFRSIKLAEEQLKIEAGLDSDGDGIGEYGDIGALVGKQVMKIKPGELENGVVVQDGYCFKVFVPDAADKAEVAFAAYAWPADGAGDRGRAYFINEKGDVHQTMMSSREYMGRENGPSADAAYTGEAFFSEIAQGKAKPGKDGNVWRMLRGPGEAPEAPVEGQAAAPAAEPE